MLDWKKVAKGYRRAYKPTADALVAISKQLRKVEAEAALYRDTLETVNSVLPQDNPLKEAVTEVLDSEAEGRAVAITDVLMAAFVLKETATKTRTPFMKSIGGAEDLSTQRAKRLLFEALDRLNS